VRQIVHRAQAKFLGGLTEGCKTMTTTIDYAAARNRLASVTADPAALAGMDRISPAISAPS
jgi:hypothetical protein